MFFFAQDYVANNEQFGLSAQKAAKGVFEVQTMGSPRTLKLVFTTIGQLVSFLNFVISA